MSGRHVMYPEVAVQPRPVQPGGPEVWIGGSGRRVWARIARSRAAGWHGIGHKAELFEAARAGIAKACAAAGRDPSLVRLSNATGMPSDPD
jgi:alkanesulfonate monooxygenase SsuD/methylene tetrahydromethanopterin reductase-like flavin-dependent oxidoreductase (luciferase family)